MREQLIDISAFYAAAIMCVFLITPASSEIANMERLIDMRQALIDYFMSKSCDEHAPVDAPEPNVEQPEREPDPKSEEYLIDD